MMNSKKYLLISGLGLFIAALFSPGIVFKPDTRANPKASSCAFAVKDNVMCESFTFGGVGTNHCGRVDAMSSSKTLVEKQKILDYCKGWDTPYASVNYGYHILLLGGLGVFVGVFAWFANPLILLALLLAKLKLHLAAKIFSIFSILLGLQSYALKAVPFNESSMEAGNLQYVDHLGLGFYLWLASLVVLSVYCFLNTRENAPPQTPRAA